MTLEYYSSHMKGRETENGTGVLNEIVLESHLFYTRLRSSYEDDSDTFRWNPSDPRSYSVSSFLVDVWVSDVVSVGVVGCLGPHPVIY